MDEADRSQVRTEKGRVGALKQANQVGVCGKRHASYRKSVKDGYFAVPLATVFTLMQYLCKKCLGVVQCVVPLVLYYSTVHCGIGNARGCTIPGRGGGQLLRRNLSYCTKREKMGCTRREDQHAETMAAKGAQGDA